jgi:nucleotide-binding universal stress UspA family protein
VVVGLDGTATARAALARAAEAATETGAQLVAVSAFQLPECWSDLGVAFLESLDDVRNAAREQAESMVTGVLGESPGVPVRVVTVHGPPADVLAQQAAGADLLVVGSRSRLSGMLLGSVALHCVVHAPCPVMVVHPSRHAPEPVGQVRAGATG